MDKREQEIRLVFIISLVLKGLFALAETISGLLTYLTPAHFLVNAIQVITKEELSEDPRDFIANYFLHLAQGLSVSALHFAALYLLIHGVVKLWLVIGLLRKKLWYYPTAIVIFGLFIAYQLYRYTFTHSWLLLAITIMDLIVIALTWHEYQYLQKELKSPLDSTLNAGSE